MKSFLFLTAGLLITSSPALAHTKHHGHGHHKHHHVHVINHNHWHQHFKSGIYHKHKHKHGDGHKHHGIGSIRHSVQIHFGIPH